MVLRFLFLFLVLLYSAKVNSQLLTDELARLNNLGAVFDDLNNDLKQAKKTKSISQTTMAHYNLAIFCSNHRVYTEALHQYNNTINLLEEKKNDTLYAKVLNQVGSIHLELRNYNYAKDYFIRSEKAAELIRDSVLLALATSNLGSCFEKQKKYKEALEYQNKSLQIFYKLNNDSGLAIVNESIGSIYEDLENYKLAELYFKKALKYNKNEKNSRLASIYNNLGDTYRKTNRLNIGLDYTNKALSTAVEIKNTLEVASAYKDISKSYNLIGDYKNAYTFLQSFLKVDTENKRLQSANQSNALQHIYNSKEKESQIQYLLQLNKANKSQKLVLVVLVFMVVVFGVVWYLYTLKKRRHISKELDFKQRILKIELDKKQAEEKNLQKQLHIKTASLSRYSLHLSQKNKMLSNLSLTLKNSLQRNNVDLKRKLTELIKEIDFNLAQEKEWDEFMAFFKEIHPNFINKISNAVTSKLSPAELRLCILLKLNLSSKEIASILRLTPDSVRVARYRLRKKLPIDSKEELSLYLMSF
ncbi:tetratricopeptide repeat protein [Cellulophaga fucicola]|uniref:DNA-binding transcriptional regulator, CsgD family n=1 Tax=Cellulophaga fucicola TaxID=76595 RepID=A0A1K1QPV3_9FLAO|nr:transcriptional regulator [Cellulophaga fucicola]SFW61920.1 DNA-binding transcriptional regulator, CsgD family [Cellulophaga fucicola]